MLYSIHFQLDQLVKMSVQALVEVEMAELYFSYAVIRFSAVAADEEPLASRSALVYFFDFPSLISYSTDNLRNNATNNWLVLAASHGVEIESFPLGLVIISLHWALSLLGPTLAVM